MLLGSTEMFFRRIGLLFLLTLPACHTARNQSPLPQTRIDHQLRARAPTCHLPYHVAWSSDSLISLCLPEQFTELDSTKIQVGTQTYFAVWQRSISPYWYARVELSFWRERPTRHWPIYLPYGCPDWFGACERSQSIRIEDDTMFGKPFHRETGSLVGGFIADEHLWERVVSWRPEEGGYASLDMASTNEATLDTLEGLVRTIRIRDRRSLKK